MSHRGKARGNIYARLAKLEARAPRPTPPQHGERVSDFLDRLVAWRQAGCPDTEEGRELRVISEAFRRRQAELSAGNDHRKERRR
jgi:hypothetical protein